MQYGRHSPSPLNTLKSGVYEYIGSQFWNQGRTEEIKDRWVHLGNDL